MYICYITICFRSIDNYQFKSSKGMAWHFNLPMWCYLTCWVCTCNTSYVFHFLTVLLNNLFYIITCKFFRIFYMHDAARWRSTKNLFLLINKFNFYKKWDFWYYCLYWKNILDWIFKIFAKDIWAEDYEIRKNYRKTTWKVTKAKMWHLLFWKKLNYFFKWSVSIILGSFSS